MMEKLEQTKEFIEEVERLRNEAYSLHNALNTVNFTDFPNLKIFLHDAFKNNEQLNQDQITFAKIWAGEIELVEKKPKYVIYQIDDDEIVWILANNNHGALRNEIDTSTNILKNHRSYNDSSAYFDQDFAFAMRDTGKFQIEEVK